VRISLNWFHEMQSPMIPVQETKMPDPDRTDIQGNILGGFLKDHQTFMMLQIGASDVAVSAAKAWFRGEVRNQIATDAEVSAFNALFKDLRKRRGEHAIVKATWMNLAFTRHGLKTLGVSDADIARMDPSFAADVKVQATAVLGDTGDSAPDRWKEAYREDAVDAVIILASDDEDDLRAEELYFTQQAEDNGLQVLRIERGRARSDKPGHEHFGFKDGISQPKIAGVDENGDVSPWLFVVDATPQPPPPAQPVPPGYPQPPPAPPTGPPDFTHQGSYLVFRRLKQLVPQWQQFVEDACPVHLNPDRFAAKIVGRYENGAPYERIPSLPSYDPDAGEPSSQGAQSPIAMQYINAFDYTQDADGHTMPHAAHIRKTNPRDAALGQRRILRRGIAYGEPYDEEAGPGSPRAADADRGLLFVSYQASIRDQFEFIQQSWANEPNFPTGHDPEPGVDVLIGQPKDGRRFFSMPGPQATPEVAGISTFVQTTGTLYCFSPAISKLSTIGS
jgi:Dyp-type peroxidase family